MRRLEGTRGWFFRPRGTPNSNRIRDGGVRAPRRLRVGRFASGSPGRPRRTVVVGSTKRAGPPLTQGQFSREGRTEGAVPFREQALHSRESSIRRGSVPANLETEHLTGKGGRPGRWRYGWERADTSQLSDRTSSPISNWEPATSEDGQGARACSSHQDPATSTPAQQAVRDLLVACGCDRFRRGTWTRRRAVPKTP